MEVEDEATEDFINSLRQVVYRVDDIEEAYKTSCRGEENTWFGCAKEMTRRVRLFGEELVESARIVVRASGDINACVWGATKELSSFYFQMYRRVRECRNNSV